MKELAKVAIGLVISAAIAPAGVPAPQDPGVYQVLRPTDRGMSCDQLMNEANALSGELRNRQQKQAQAMQMSATPGGDGMASGVAMSAAQTGAAMAGSQLGSFVPFAGSLFSMGAAARQRKRAEEAQRKMAEAQTQAMTPPPQQERLNHVMELYRQKQC